MCVRSRATTETRLRVEQSPRRAISGGFFLSSPFHGEGDREAVEGRLHALTPSAFRLPPSAFRLPPSSSALTRGSRVAARSSLPTQCRRTAGSLGQARGGRRINQHPCPVAPSSSAAKVVRDIGGDAIMKKTTLTAVLAAVLAAGAAPAVAQDAALKAAVKADYDANLGA